jgi:hypothetical protein
MNRVDMNGVRRGGILRVVRTDVHAQGTGRVVDGDDRLASVAAAFEIEFGEGRAVCIIDTYVSDVGSSSFAPADAAAAAVCMAITHAYANRRKHRYRVIATAAHYGHAT